MHPQDHRGRDLVDSTRTASPTDCKSPAHPKGAPGWCHCLDVGAVTDLLINKVHPVVPRVRLAARHCNHPDPLEAFPVNLWR